MFLEFWRDVEALLRDALDRCGFPLPEADGKVEGNELLLEMSPHADLASTISFRLAPVLKKSPAEISRRLQEAIVLEGKGTVDRAEAMASAWTEIPNRSTWTSSRTLAWGSSRGSSPSPRTRT